MEVPLLVFCCSMAISSVISAAIESETEHKEEEKRDPFHYGRKCRCKFNQHQRTGEPLEEEGTLRASIRRMSSRRL
ncbi:hypothetical protein XENTR_v10019663 [Xenopus tropicalis]|nr:hypothetical protein XENTR_v10019663 [Xenopus tropicalis]